MRMTEDEIARKVLTMQVDRRRKRDRPKLRRIDNVSNDAKLFGLREWTAIASGRDRRRRLLEDITTPAVSCTTKDDVDNFNLTLKNIFFYNFISSVVVLNLRKFSEVHVSPTFIRFYNYHPRELN